MNFRLWHVPVRLATGAFILNSGLSKWKAEDEDLHKNIKEMAANAYPQFESMEPRSFTRLLAASEITLGGALLAPMVGPGLAGVGLSAFSGALLGLYMRTPGMREHGSIRPSGQGMAIAKDSWLLAMGTALMLDAAANRVRRVLPGRS